MAGNDLGPRIRLEQHVTLTPGGFISYEYDRMVVLFSMWDADKEIACAISTSALDAIDSASRTTAAQREAQFLQLRDRVEAEAARKYLAGEMEGHPPGIILRAIDFRAQARSPFRT